MCNDDKRPNDFQGVWDKLRKINDSVDDIKPQRDRKELQEQIDDLDEELKQLAEAFDPGYRANVMNGQVDMEAAASMILEALDGANTLKDITTCIYNRAQILICDPGDRRLVADVFAMCLAWSAARGTTINDLAMSAFLRNHRKDRKDEP